jgi:hypothetical protein
MLLDMVEVDSVTGESVTMTSSVNASSPEFLGFSIGEVPSVSLIQNTIGKCASGSDREEVAL